MKPASNSWESESQPNSKILKEVFVVNSNLFPSFPLPCANATTKFDPYVLLRPVIKKDAN
jgi:hypothetical protein